MEQKEYKTTPEQRERQRIRVAKYRSTNKAAYDKQVKNYIDRNREKLNETTRDWRNKNKERLNPIHKQQQREYYEKNKDKINARFKLLRPLKREKLNAKLKEYAQTPLGIYAHIKHSAERRVLSFTPTKDQFVKWYSSQPTRCHYCKRELNEILGVSDSLNRLSKRLSIDRKDNARGYELDNMVLSCRRCNAIKSDFFTESEMLTIGKMVYKKYHGLKKQKQEIDRQLSMFN